MHRRDGITILISLHQVEYALSYCPRTIALKAGKIAYDGPSAVLTPALLCSIYGAEASELVAHSTKPAAPAKRPPKGAAAALAAPHMDTSNASDSSRRELQRPGRPPPWA